MRWKFLISHPLPPAATIPSPMTLVKDNLVQTLYDQAGFSKQKARTTVQTVFELVKKALESGEDVLISGFGKFIVREKASRRGRNPATGQDLTLDPRRVIMFKCSGVMRERINGGSSSFKSIRGAGGNHS
jgi:integration host factor subunit alpha